MHFYKILQQRNNKVDSFIKTLEGFNYQYIVGKHSNSFAIEYDPEKYNEFLSDTKVFSHFQQKAIQQLLMTNQKFLGISKYQNDFDFKMIDCLFDQDLDKQYFEEYYDNYNFETIYEITNEYDFSIKEITFRTNKNKKVIVLQKNGVIGLDDGLSVSEREKISNFIDTLNFGLKVIK